jgi:translation initiation factor 4G
MNIEIKELEKTDNAYSVAKKEDLEADDVLKRKINSILNKLTPEKFDALTEQFFELEVDNVVKLDYVVSCIFEKALVMPSYTPTYARFCKILANDPRYQFNDGTSFKKKLLNECQKEFEKGSGQDENKVFDSEEDKTEYLIKVKQRRWGNIRFIGELYCRGLIVVKIVYVCFGYLLPNPEEPDEEAVEALCKLFHTIGAQLWKKETNKKEKRGLNTLKTLQALAAAGKITSSRIRFLIQDTVDMAKRNWVARLKKAEAKTISEIHAEEAMRERKVKAASARAPRQYENYQTKPVSSKVYHSNRPRKPRKQDADGWESTPQKSTRQKRGGKQIMRQQDRKFSARGRGGGRSGGRGGGYRGQNDSPPKPKRQNMYDILLNADESSDSAPSSPATPASQAGMPASQPPPLDLEPPAEEVEEEPLTADEIKAKESSIRAFLAEYFSIRDVQEVKKCISDLKTTQMHASIVFEGFGAAFEKKDVEHKLFGDLLETLLTEGILLNQHIRAGYDLMMEWGNDFAPDYPFMFKILGEWTARLILHPTHSMDLAYLASAAPQQLNIRGQNLHKFVAGTLQALTSRTDADTVKNMVDATEGFDLAGLGLTPEILQEQNLSFLI